MPGNKFFSVIICTYNREQLVQAAIKSVIKQTFDSWELIIFDDGSTDHTYMEVLKYIAYDNRISYYRAPHNGVVKSRNTALKLCRGEYITFLDSDDRYEPNHLEERKRIIDENPGIQIIHGGVKVIGNDRVVDKNNLKRLIKIEDCVIDSTLVIKRSALSKIGEFPVKDYASASYLVDRAIKNGIKVKQINIPTYIYNRHSDNSICNEKLKNFYN